MCQNDKWDHLVVALVDLVHPILNSHKTDMHGLNLVICHHVELKRTGTMKETVDTFRLCPLELIDSWCHIWTEKWQDHWQVVLDNVDCIRNKNLYCIVNQKIDIVEDKWAYNGFKMLWVRQNGDFVMINERYAWWNAVGQTEWWFGDEWKIVTSVISDKTLWVGQNDDFVMINARYVWRNVAGLTEWWILLADDWLKRGEIIAQKSLMEKKGMAVWLSMKGYCVDLFLLYW